MVRLRIPLARANISQPPSGETKVTIVESVRDCDVYILNTVSGDLLEDGCSDWVNDETDGIVRVRGL